MTEKTPNIKFLNKLILQHQISIQVSSTSCLPSREDYREVTLNLSNQSFTFFVDDEYDDFKYNYPILNLCIVLRELEDYKYANDFLIWCTERHFDASDEKLRVYYISLDKVYNDIESILGEIKSFIPDSAFEFNMGEAWVLREGNW